MHPVLSRETESGPGPTTAPSLGPLPSVPSHVLHPVYQAEV